MDFSVNTLLSFMPNISAYQPAKLSPAARFWVLLGFLVLATFGSRVFAYDATVAADGSGNFTTVQAAINAAPMARTVVYTIFIKNGRYREKISIPATKPFLQLIGESVANTILTYNDGASTLVGGIALGTQNSASFSVSASDFSALNITFENTFGDGSQAVTVLLNADHIMFKNCRLLGNQDTLYVKGSGTPQHYFRDCYIDGNVDFIFGSSVAIFDRCVVYGKSRSSAGASFITAANTPPGQAFGFIFHNTRLPSNTGTTQYFLGRPWQNSTGSVPPTQNKVVFIKPTMGANQIQPAGWTAWDAGTDTNIITYREFRPRYFNGNNLNISQRVAWSRQLAVADTAQYQTSTVFGAWNPCAVASNVCTAFVPDIAVANFRAAKGAALTTIDWNISWAMANIRYDLLRSADNVTFTPINTVTAANDSTYNFQMTDALPVAGTNYYYKVQASKAGLATHTTPTVLVSSVATIVTNTATLGTFAQYQTGTSAVQTYSISATNLTANLTVTPPASYEVSANGTTWYGNSTPLVLTPTANTVTATISVRLNAATAGSYAGNITHVSPGAVTQNVAVTGTKVNTPAPISNPLQWWSLRVSDQDSAAIRSAAVVATAPTLRRYALSNGTTVTTVPARSTSYGQAFAATPDGLWTVAANGPGSAVDRRYYEQFKLTARAGSPVRIDSLLLSTMFFNTTGKLAVAYSKTGFVPSTPGSALDSVDVTGGRGPGGMLQPTANGAFATPVAIANTPNQGFRFALNNAAGVTLAGGQTLTVRLYFACNSSSAGRYLQLKNVVLKGDRVTVASSLTAKNGMSLQLYPNPTAGQATVTLLGYQRPATLTIVNALGQTVFAQAVSGSATPVSLDLSKLAGGVYLLRVSNADATLSQRLVRE